MPSGCNATLFSITGSKPGTLQDGSYLTWQKFKDLLRLTLREAGLDAGKYAALSFKIGVATSAKDVGIDDVHIKMLGRWKSNAYQLYVRTP